MEWPDPARRVRADDETLLAEAPDDETRVRDASSGGTGGTGDDVPSSGSGSAAALVDEDSDDPFVGRRFGNLQITGLIGEGGMGAVYRGFDGKLRRPVAMKAIRAGRVGREERARFLREARILSQLDTPHICRIYDYVDGTDTDFLVLELVPGRTLKDALEDDDTPLPVDTRYTIAEQILEVLMAAHAVGIIHRDLKPANVMVTPAGDAKLLDFGVAHALEPGAGHDESAMDLELTRSPLAQAMPPANAQPEAATMREEPPSGPRSPFQPPSGAGLRGDGARSDSDQSDTGGSSGSGGDVELGDTALVQTRLGSIVGTAGYMSPEQAAGQRLTPAADIFACGLLFQELFTGRKSHDAESGWELMHQAVAGESRPVEGLAPELTRLIERMKSKAPGSRPSALDALERLRAARAAPRRVRERRMVAAALVVLAALTLVLSFLALRLSQEAKRSELQAERAERETATARQVADFLVQMFEVASPDRALGESITTRQLLDQASLEIAELADPGLRGRLAQNAARVYRNLALFDEAESLVLGTLDGLPAPDAATRAGTQPGPEASSLATARLGLLTELGAIRSSRGELASAIDVLHEAEDLVPEALSASEIELARLHEWQAKVHLQLGHHDEAEEHAKSCLDMWRTSYGPQSRQVATAQTILAEILNARGALDASEALHREAYAVFLETLGPDHLDTARAAADLGGFLRRRGETAEAESLYRSALAAQNRAYGEQHPEVARTLNSLGFLMRVTGRFDQAREFSRRALEIREALLDPNHADIAQSLENLAELAEADGDPASAEPLWRRAVAIRSYTLGRQHTDRAWAIHGLGNNQLQLGNPQLARPLLQESLDIMVRNLGPGHRWLAWPRHGLCRVALREDRIDDALELCRQAESSLADDRQDDPKLLEIRADLADLERRGAGQPVDVHP